jgi:hypothetical protein
MSVIILKPGRAVSDKKIFTRLGLPLAVGFLDLNPMGGDVFSWEGYNGRSDDP